MTPRRLAAGLFLTDAALTLAYLADVWAGSPYLFLGRVLDLDGEANLPTWYASAKLLTLGLLLGLLAWRSPGRVRSAFLFLPAALAVLLSLDEVASIHEWVGFRSDALLAGGDRKASFLPVTGIWMFLLGPLVLAAALAAHRALRPFLPAAPAAGRLFLVGLVVLLGGAMGAELGANVVVPGTWAAALQVAVEEGAELAGVTTLLWGAMALVAAHGIAAAQPASTGRIRTLFIPRPAIVPERRRSA